MNDKGNFYTEWWGQTLVTGVSSRHTSLAARDGAPSPALNRLRSIT